MKNGFANKYRPQSWDEVIGNKTSVESLKNLIEKEGGSRAFLLEGHTGSGKTTLARICAKVLNCASRLVIEIDCVTEGGIDVVRDVKKHCMTSTAGQNRVFICDEAHMLTPKAQEGLLKLLEDGKSTDYIFFCTTEANVFKKTFLGRVQKIIINRLSDEEIEDVLFNVIDGEKLDISDDVLDIIVETCDGSARDAINKLESIAGMHNADAYEKLKNDENSTIETSLELKTFMNAFCSNKGNFKSYIKMMKDIKALGKEQPEGIRLATIGYANAMRMNGNDSEQIEMILDNFLYDYEGIYNKGQAWALLVDKIFKVCQ